MSNLMWLHCCIAIKFRSKYQSMLTWLWWLIKVLLLCPLVSYSWESAPCNWLTFDGFLKTILCSVLEPWGSFLPLNQGWFFSSLGIRGGLLEAAAGWSFRPLRSTRVLQAMLSVAMHCVTRCRSHHGFKDKKYTWIFFELPIYLCHNIQGYMRSTISYRNNLLSRNKDLPVTIQVFSATSNKHRAGTQETLILN